MPLQCDCKSRQLAGWGSWLQLWHKPPGPWSLWRANMVLEEHTQCVNRAVPPGELPHSQAPTRINRQLCMAGALCTFLAHWQHANSCYMFICTQPLPYWLISRICHLQKITWILGVNIQQYRTRTQIPSPDKSPVNTAPRQEYSLPWAKHVVTAIR